MKSIIVTVTPGNFTDTIETNESTLSGFLKNDAKVRNIISSRLGGGAYVIHLNGDKHSADSTVVLDSWAEIALSKDVKGADNN